MNPRSVSFRSAGLPLGVFALLLGSFSVWILLRGDYAMLETVAERNTALEEAKALLEQRVAEQTRELRQAKRYHWDDIALEADLVRGHVVVGLRLCE